MRKLIILLAFIPSLVYCQHDVTIRGGYAEIILSDSLYLSGFYDAVRIETPHTINVATKINQLSTNLYPEYPGVGTFVERDKIYNYNGELVQVVQSHNITHYNPHDVPALFSFYRTPTTGMIWIENEVVSVGDKRTYQSIEYECMQGHLTQNSWNPILTLGVLWAVVATTQAWTVGVAYNVNDEVTYQGSTYRCRQAHTSIATWTPTAAASLWLKL